MINMTLSGVKKSDAATAGALLEKLFFFSQKNTCVRASLTIKFQTSASAWQFIKKTPWHTCFSVNFEKFLRTPILENITGWASQVFFRITVPNFPTKCLHSRCFPVNFEYFSGQLFDKTNSEDCFWNYFFTKMFTSWISFGKYKRSQVLKRRCPKKSSKIWKKLPVTEFNFFQRGHCMKSAQIQNFFWSVFSCIRTELRI